MMIRLGNSMVFAKLKRMQVILLLVFVALTGSPRYLSAQSNVSYEFWPETDIWYRLNPSWRLSAFLPITKYHESKNRDMNVYLQADYAWGKTKILHYGRLFNEARAELMKAWLARGGYMHGWSLGEESGSYYEDMLFAEIHRRMPVGKKTLISHRIRPELRWLGQDPTLSFRFRYRAMVEREFNSGKFSVIPYINAEPYWDSRYAAFNRIRLIGGATMSWGPRLALEGNITYQHDTHYDTSNLYALNIIVHLFFETRRSKSNNR